MGRSIFSTPREDRFFEDYEVGCVYEFGSVTVDEAEVIEFGNRFDPQEFHIDPEAAKKSIFGGLIASGWHTAALTLRLYAGCYLSAVASIPSPAVDELRWTKPVRPGDELSIRVTVLDARRSKSKPDRGIVHSFVEVTNQNKEVVMTMKPINFLSCREKR